MLVRKMALTTGSAMPLIAALPYAIDISASETMDSSVAYNPLAQLTVFASRRDFSTCRRDESVGLLQSKSDTQKDD